MTDQQLLTLALAFIVPISLLIYSNSRITEAKETLRAETQTLRTEMNAGFKELRAETAASFKDLRNIIERNQEALLTELARIDGRVSHLEDRIH